MEGEEEREEITMEELYEDLKAAAIIACFEKKFGRMPPPLRYFKFRRWMRDFKVFLEGVECGEVLMLKVMTQALQKAERRSIEVMGGNE